ncbi:MAG: AI-2E family transporter [Casimicrobiaceae bacterium]
MAAVAAVTALKEAQAFFIPVFVGVIGAYALRPIVNQLAAWKLPEGVAAALVMLTLLTGVVGGAYLLRDQAAGALDELPHVAHMIRMRVRQVVYSPTPSPLAHVKQAAAELKKAASEVSGEPAVPTAPTSDVVDRLAANGVDALGALATLGIAFAIMLFLLAAGDSFRRKLLHVVGNTLRERRTTLAILDDIDGQVQRYLAVMVATNVTLGFVLWGGYAVLGLHRAAFWAVCVAILHAIPYVGVVFALVLMTGVAVLEFTGVGMIFWVLVCTAVSSVLIGLLLQNWLQGRASQMNPVAVFIAVLFFGWLWGGWGLLLGAPLIAMVRTVASHIESLAALGEFLSAHEVRTRAAAVAES